ncbi:MAG: hypothetical protein RL632_168 [Bacteroidota bacterium]|jgi:hypothetical protein
MKKLILIVFVTTISSVHAAIAPLRQRFLDSVVTNVPANTLKNLDSLHRYLHDSASTDEERVFMYYGLFGIHFKYDQARFKAKYTREYTPAYTLSKRRGVCRDFADLFMELCKRSEIPCVVALGSTKKKWYEVPGEIIHRRRKQPNHAWNIVKFNEEWHLMDPTWSSVRSIEKIYGKDAKGKTIFRCTIKTPVRDYYDASSTFFYQERNAVHPAYYLSSTIFSFKTALRKQEKRKVEVQDYPYAQVLDCIAENTNEQMSRDFYNSEMLYAKRTGYYYRMGDFMLFYDMKRAPHDPLTEEKIQQNFQEFQTMIKFLESEFGTSFQADYSFYVARMNKELATLKRKSGGFSNKTN